MRRKIKLIQLYWKFLLPAKIESEYDQEIPQSQTADYPVAPRGRADNHHETPGRQIKQSNQLSPARMQKINLRLKALEWSQQISHYKSMVFFRRSQRAANSTGQGLIWPNFEPIKDLMVVLVTCKNGEDPIKGVRVVTTLSINFQDAQGRLTP